MLALSTISQLSAYTYPIGVPTAWIAPDAVSPGRPVDWSSEVPGYYFIDYSAGTNTGRTYGTPTAPRKTIPSTFGPGTYYEVKGLTTMARTFW